MMDNHNSNMTVAIWTEVKNLMIAYSRKFEDCARATRGSITMHCMPQHACMKSTVLIQEPVCKCPMVTSREAKSN